MPRERLPMRKIGDVLRLHAGGLSKRRIAVSLNIGRTAVGDYISRARRAGLGWPLPEGLSEEGTRLGRRCLNRECGCTRSRSFTQRINTTFKPEGDITLRCFFVYPTRSITSLIRLGALRRNAHSGTGLNC
jgi:hypothetical protein